jgi:hypothetical protein
MFIELCGWVRLNYILSFVAASGYTAKKITVELA